MKTLQTVAVIFLLSAPCYLQAQEVIPEETVDPVVGEPQDEEVEQVFFAVEKMPSWKGCESSEQEQDCTMEKISHHIRNTIEYPEIAKESGIEGRVFIQFVVNKLGAVEDVKVVRSADPSLDAEALRVVKSLPDFNPGIQRGKKVKVSYNIPIKFVL